MKQYIKKFFILLIVWALLLDTTTVFAISAITANRMEKTISNKVDDTQRSKIEKDNLKRLSNKEGSDNKSVNQVSIDKPLINSSILDGDGVIEDKSKRTLYSRTIQNEEGKYRVEQSLFPIFKEVNGEFVDIDNSFINKRSNGLYSNSLSLDNKIVMDIISSNKSNLKIIFEEDNENESDIEGNVAKINQSNNYNNYEIINEDYLINTKINVKRNNNSLYYELDEVNSYSISESNIMINDGEFTIFPIYYQDLYLKTEIVKKDDKKFLRIDTSKVKEENFIFELKIGVNPIKKSLARISSSLNLSGYKYSNTNTNLPDESIVNTDLNVGYDKSANPAPHLRSYVTFTKPTLSNSYGAIEKAQLKYKIQVEAGSQNINVNMSSTSIKPTDVTWNNRNNYTWQKIGAGTRNNDGTYSFNVLTYLNHLKNNGNQRTLEFKGYEGTDYNRLDLYSTNVKLIVDYEYDFASNSKLTTSLRAHSKGRGEVASISFVGIGAPTKNVTYTLKTYDKKGNTINAKTKNTPNFTKTASKKKIIPTFISNYKDKMQKYDNVSINYDSGYLNRSRFKVDTYYDYEIKSNGETLISQGFMFYKVKPGDTLKSIAKYYKVSLKTIKYDNNFKGNKVKTGNILFLRGMSSYKKPSGKHSASKNKKINRKKMKFCATCGTKYKFVADPVNPNTGNFFLVTSDVELNDSQNFTFYRSYNSIDMSNSGLFGYSWITDIEQRISFEDSKADFDTEEMEDVDEDVPEDHEDDVGDQLLFVKGDGNLITFKLENGKYIAEEYDKYKVNEYETGKYSIEDLEKKTTSYFDDSGMLVKIVDDKKKSVALEYTNEGELLDKIKTSNGREIKFNYNDENLVSSIVLPNGSSAKYEYEDGNLTKVIDQLNKEERYSYNEEGLMEYYIDKNGHKLGQNKYDEEGKILEQTTESGQTYKFTYDNGKTSVKDPEGNIKDYNYDELYRLSVEDTDDGSGTQKFYDNKDNLIKEISGNGETTTYEYDLSNNLIKQNNPDGTIIENEYDSDNYVTKTTYNSERFEEFKYDSNKNITEYRDIYGNITKSEYDNENQLIKEVDQKGIITTFTYEQGNVKTKNIDNRQIETNTYDSLGNVIKTVDQDGNFDSFEYDLKGNMIKERNKLGAITTYEYDNSDNIIKEVSSTGLVTTRKYDERNNEIEENVGGKVTTKEYDANNNLIKEIDYKNNVIKNEYDSNNNLIKTIDAQGNVETNKYDNNGNIIESKDIRGNITKREYNSNNMPIKEIDIYGNVTEIEYDKDGNEVKKTDGRNNVETSKFEEGLPVEQVDINGNKTITKYDKYKREEKVIEETANGNIETSYEYDKYDNITKESDNIGNVTTRKYDANDNVIEENINGKITKTKYDALSNELEVIRPNGLKIQSKYDEQGQLVEQVEGSKKTTYEYDKFGNQIKVIDPMNNITLATYEYDKVVEEINAKGIKTAYKYDEYDQLIETKVNGVIKEKIEYDRYGEQTYKEDNEATISTTYNSYGQIESETNNGYTKYFEYDKFENIIVEKDIKGIVKKNTFDKFNNLIKTESATGKIETYKFDKSNQEIEKKNIDGTIDKTYYDIAGNEVKTIDGQGIVTEFIYDKDRLVKEIVNKKSITSYKYDVMDNVIEENNNGAISKTEYDLYGNEIKEVSPNGNVTEFQYDNNGNNIRTINADGTSTTSKYDALNQVIEETNELNYKKTYVYDAWNNQIKLIDEMNFVYENVYDNKDRLIKEILPNKKVSLNNYDLNNNLVSSTDYNGNITKTTYDYKNREKSIKQPNGLIETYTYDKDDNVIKVVDSNKRTRQTIYNKKNQIIEEKENNKTMSKYSYNSKSQKIKESNAKNVVTSFKYDNFNQVIKETTGSRYIASTYDVNGNVVKENESNLNIIKTTYDKEGNVLSVKENGLVTEKNKYDKMNRLSETTNEKNITTKSHYDKVGNEIKAEEIYYSGKTKKTRLISLNTYDKLGRTITSENALKAKTKYEYDALSNVTKEIDALGNVQEFNYDGNNNIIKYKDQTKGVVSYKYDSMNNVIAKKSIGKTSSNKYDKYGNVIKKVDDYGYTTSYKYDKFNNKIQEVKPDKTKLTYKYDLESNQTSIKSKKESITKKYNKYNELISATNKEGILSYQYNNLGNITKYKDVNKKVVTYKYDKRNNVKEMNYANKKVNYAYNSKNLLVSTKENNKVIEKYSYDELARLSSVSKRNKTKTNYKYDKLDRLIKIQTKTNRNKNIEAINYSYNLNDSVTSEIKVDKNGKQVKSMKYNARDELIESTISNKKGKVKTSYAYDIEGNKTIAKNGKIKERYTYNKRGQLTKIKSLKGEKVYSYDNNGNVKKIKQNDGTIDRLTYNEFGLMVSYKNKKMESTYKYDGNNVRIQSQVKDVKKYKKSQEDIASEFDTVASKLNYLEDAFNCDIELNGSGDYSSLGYEYNYYGNNSNKDNGIETIDYLTNGEVEEAQVLNEDSSKNDNDKTYTYGYDIIKSNNDYYLTKLNGSISKILNEKGKVKKSFEYSDYGKELNGYKNGLAYNGEMVDATGLQYLRARYLDLNMGSFVQKDSYLGEQDSIVSQNQYAYVLNNPYKYIDSSGNKASSYTDKYGSYTKPPSPPKDDKKKKEVKTIETGNGNGGGPTKIKDVNSNASNYNGKQLVGTWHGLFDYFKNEYFGKRKYKTTWVSAHGQVRHGWSKEPQTVADLNKYNLEQENKQKALMEKHGADYLKGYNKGKNSGVYVDMFLTSFIPIPKLSAIKGGKDLFKGAKGAKVVKYSTNTGKAAKNAATGTKALKTNKAWYIKLGEKIVKGIKKCISRVAEVFKGVVKKVVDSKIGKTVTKIFKSNKGKRTEKNLPKNLRDMITFDKNGYTKSNPKAGTAIHKWWWKNKHNPDKKLFKEYTIYRKKIDFLDYNKYIVYELKPNNPRAIASGKKQAAKYVKLLEETDPSSKGKWKIKIKTY